MMEKEITNNNLHIQENIYAALRNNSKTAHLTDIDVQVDRGIVNLSGTVESQEDIPWVYSIVTHLVNVVKVQNRLTVDGEEQRRAEAKEEQETRQAGHEEPKDEAEIEDIVDETLEDSFPASDPPSWTSSGI